MAIKSILKPENSIIAGLAVVGLVYAIYQLDVGPVSSVALTDPGHPVTVNSVKKAAWTSLALVAGTSLIAKDANVAILGSFTVIAMQSHYRHANLMNPQTGKMEAPAAGAYQPAQNVVPITQQGQVVGASG